MPQSMKPGVRTAWLALMLSTVPDEATGQPKALTPAEQGQVMLYSGQMIEEFRARCPHWNLLNEDDKLAWTRGFIDQVIDEHNASFQAP